VKSSRPPKGGQDDLRKRKDSEDGDQNDGDAQDGDAKKKERPSIFTPKPPTARDLFVQE